MSDHPLEVANRASATELQKTLLGLFPDLYTPTGTNETTLEVRLKDGIVKVEVFTSSELSPAWKEWCFDLFERNMKAIYLASEDGYDPLDKQEELFEVNSRFVILSSGGNPLAYTMFRFDQEETMTDRLIKVVYCYELQVELSIQGRGGGRLLVELLSHLSRIWGMEKVMITVFKSNTPAINFYEKCLFRIDEISPSEFEGDDSDYEIMSRLTTTAYRSF